jgi:hypothetical protein
MNKSKYFLVARGMIIYHPDDHEIEWLNSESDDLKPCYSIKLDKKVKVITNDCEKYQNFLDDVPHFRGNELWANGKHYLIKLNLGGGERWR